ncbi:hypothetical protein P106B_64 [Rhizobium phage vB_RglS_P106B]|uniref:Uncharacterized protein n=1 Tax=Rhizobium phage vB_RglS_P106B TaxID=1458697 RepID=W6EC38_9CAUD|nr:hypothetical protein P106B_64 [Rhizobium phage vB_RglS_P106B]AHJ10747.1 hypothetical protein P106B_64 [Rhizobium phage vB_RglS_P106B]
MKSADIHISQDGKIFVKGQYVGFTEDEKVYVIGKTGALSIGSYDHRSEITALVLEWFDGRR